MCDPPINQNSLQVGVKIESCCFMRRSMKGERVEKVKEEKRVGCIMCKCHFA